MRVLFSIIGLLVVVAIVGMLVKTQLTTSTPHPSTPAIDTTIDATAIDASLDQLHKAQGSGNPKAVQDAYKKALDETLKTQQEKLKNIENSAVAE